MEQFVSIFPNSPTKNRRVKPKIPEHLLQITGKNYAMNFKIQISKTTTHCKISKVSVIVQDKTSDGIQSPHVLKSLIH